MPRPARFTAQEMKSNQQTSRKSSNVIFPDKKRCHSSRPLGQGRLAYVSEDLGTYLMPSVLDLMGADGALAADVRTAAAARSFIFSFHCLFRFLFILLVLFYRRTSFSVVSALTCHSLIEGFAFGSQMSYLAMLLRSETFFFN